MTATSQPLPVIAILGGGVMGGAVAAGAIAGGWPAGEVRVAGRNPEKLGALVEQLGVAPYTSLAEATRGADIVVFAVKPQDGAAALDEFASEMKPGAMLLTVAAGLPSSFYEKRLAPGTAVVRAMPNTPSQIGKGATGIAPGTHATDDHMDLAQRMLTGTGLVVRVAESQINALAAVSGSGPAYFFAFVEAMTEAGVMEGLDREVAAQLAAQTLVGAGALLEVSDVGPGELRARVSSKGGTTLAALGAMADAGLQTVVSQGLAANVRRSQELGAELAG